MSIKIRISGIRLSGRRKEKLAPLINRLEQQCGVRATFYEHVVGETVLEAGIELHGNIDMVRRVSMTSFVGGYLAAIEDWVST